MTNAVERGCRNLFFALLGSVLFSSSAISHETSSHETKILAQGKKIAVENCSRCHAIGLEGQSPHVKAPAFRTLSKNYPLENLSEALAEGIVSGHPDMPVFTFEPKDIDAFILYLKSLSKAP